MSEDLQAVEIRWFDIRLRYDQVQYLRKALDYIISRHDYAQDKRNGLQPFDYFAHEQASVRAEELLACVVNILGSELPDDE
jgi:hypothetical protein